jgi:hypothetical protein
MGSLIIVLRDAAAPLLRTRKKETGLKNYVVA